MDTQLKLFSLSVFLFFSFFFYFILTSKFRWTRTLAASVMFPFPHFFLNRCTYEFANFYVKYINNCVCFVSMYVSLYSMYDFFYAMSCVQ